LCYFLLVENFRGCLYMFSNTSAYISLASLLLNLNVGVSVLFSMLNLSFVKCTFFNISNPLNYNIRYKLSSVTFASFPNFTKASNISNCNDSCSYSCSRLRESPFSSPHLIISGSFGIIIPIK
jgi:hypothetical protein